MNPIEMTTRRRRPALVLLSIGLLTVGTLATGLLVAGCGRTADGTTAGSHPHQQYHCPMHPTYVADRPGDCPICGMKLVPVEPQASPAAAAASAPESAAAGTGASRRVLFYRNPMDPSVTSPVPMKDGMGMDYVPVYSDSASVSGGVEGLAAVDLGSEESRLTGIQTAVARRGTLARTIRAVGEVKADETRITRVHTKISGWVEKLFVNSSGQAVRRGQPMLTIYSPELLASQEEFLRAHEAADRFARSSVPEVRRGGEDLLAAARQRLGLFDVPASFVAELEQTGQPQRTVTLEVPVSGFVTSKDVLAGARIEPGTALFTITDLSTVWVEADVYEYEAPLVRLGQKARVTLAYEPGVEYTGRVTTIYPYLDTDTRTLRVRMEIANRGQALKPGMYVNVELATEAARGILIPESAVLDGGLRQIVYVQTGAGRFEPHLVTLGIRSDGQAQVLSGIREGDAVVVRANFLLDSESRLRAAIARTPGADTSGAVAP